MADKKKRSILSLFSKKEKPAVKEHKTPEQPEMPVILEREYDLTGVQIFTEEVRM